MAKVVHLERPPRQLLIAIRSTGSPGTGRVAVTTSTGDCEERDFVARVSRTEVDAALASTGDLDKPTVRRSGTVESIDAVQDVGARLFESLFRGRLGRIYEEEATAASEAGDRLQLRIETDDEIAELPWELLYDDLVRKDFVVLCHGWSIVREPPVEPGRPSPRFKPARPLRVLAVAADLAVAPGIEQEIAELRAIVPALHLLREPTFDGLVDALRKDQFHIIHLMGIATDLGAEQAFRLDSRADRWLDGAQLQQLLAPQKRLQLVFLNGGDTDRLARGLARTVPGTIGMQRQALGAACRAFARVVFQDLFDGKPVGLAAAEARKVIDREAPGSRQWALPVVYVPRDEAPVLGAPRTRKTHPPAPMIAEAPGGSPNQRRLEILRDIAARNVETLKARVGEGEDAGPNITREQLRHTSAQHDAFERELATEEGGHGG